MVASMDISLVERSVEQMAVASVEMSANDLVESLVVIEAELKVELNFAWRA